MIGGETAKPGQFAYQVSLRYEPYNAHFCGGSIIRTNVILSAAHCLQDNPSPQEFSVVVGAHHISNDGQKYPVIRYIIHDQFNLQNIMENE